MSEPDEPMSDEAEFALMAGHVRTVAEALLTQWFGERCPDFHEDCECCKRWRALDSLIASPFASAPPPVEQENKP